MDRVGRMARSRKRTFSTFMSRVEFRDDVLRIQGRRQLAALLLLGFGGGLGWFAVSAGEAPAFFRGLAGLTAAFVLCGFVDALTATARLEFHPRSGDLVMLRTSLFGRAAFEGTATPGMLHVERVRTGSMHDTGRVPVYQIVLKVELDDAIVKFPLELTSKGDDESAARIRHWREQLRI